MRLFLRLPPSSIVVCMQKNPNWDGLVRTVSGHRRGGYALTGRGRPLDWSGRENAAHRHVLVWPSSPLLFAAERDWSGQCQGTEGGYALCHDSLPFASCSTHAAPPLLRLPTSCPLSLTPSPRVDRMPRICLVVSSM